VQELEGHASPICASFWYSLAMTPFFKFGKSEPPTPAEARKKRSIAVLKQRGVPFIEHLPMLEDESQVTLQTVEAIFRRARARTVYFMRGQFAMDGVAIGEFRDRMHELDAWDDLTPEERLVTDAAELTQQNIIDSSWALESVAALTWVMGLSPAMAWPTGLCDASEIIACIRATKTHAGLKLRAVGEILDEADLHYRLHWACRDAMLRGKAEPAGLSDSVIVERRKTLEWVLADEPWDDVDLST
jgi:hypothetical protein